MPDVAMSIKMERRALDTMSQTSEGTTTTSASDKSGCDNREDLKDLAAKLGITNLEDMHQERFRVDRQKLEYMLLGVPAGDKGGPQPAETFFHKVMEETNTWVSWPARLKIGAKSRKDPHIKVAGRPDDVRACKEKIMEVLDTRNNNRVTMKLDVSYTDHSHIIGKGGLTIKKVMEETGCHIHFPDSNRSNHQEKSNQVSIAGEMEGVERARARVRNLTPLIFSFELPIMSSLQGVQDAMSPYIVKIQEKYNVQVMFRTRPKLHDTLVVVKGCEWEVSQVKEATVLLINDMCKNLANQIQVQMSMEISPQHHSIVLGKQSQNLKMIMQRTGTQIMFPDAGDPNIPSLKKSNVTITGSIHNVYLARQQLVGSLPLVLMFDLPEESIGSVDTEKINNLMQSLDVYINVRHKPKQSTLSVIIKGIERNASNIYEARKHLLKLDEPRVHAEIPATYHIPNASAIFNNTSSLNNMMGSENFSTSLSVNTQTPPYCMSPMQSPNPMNLSPHWGFPSIPSMFSQIPFNQAYGPYPSLSHMLTTQHMLQNGMLPPGLTNHNFTGFNPMHALNPGLHGLNNMNANMSDSKDSGAFSSLSSATSSLSSPALSPRNVSPVNTEGAPPGLDLSSMLHDLTMNDRRAPGCEKKSLEMASQHLTPYDYEQKKLMAIKAMQSKIDPKVSRNPTSSWVGYGLSHSSPAVAPNFKDSANKSDLWNDPPTPVFNTTMDFGVNAARLGMASNHLDHTPSSVVNKIQQDDSNDVASILTKIGVQKYMHLFIENEIDMATFQTLTENDLYQIGITAWGARRRILVKIAELNARSSTFSGSAAPGAERKLSSTSSTLTSGAFSNSIGSSMEKW